MADVKEALELCSECGACLDVCPTYGPDQVMNLSPLGRLRAARQIFQGEEITPEIKESIYSCLECRLCTGSCPFEIDIPEIVYASRVELAATGRGPLEPHIHIMEGIHKLGNSAGGAPEKRLDWLPEAYSPHESSTLFFAGCIASYLAQDAAASSYLLLKKLGVDFMVLPDEGCCGLYYMWAGMPDVAKAHFEQMASGFKQQGITRLILDCAGCYECFSRQYPAVMGSIDFEVVHIAQLLPALLKDRGIEVAPGGTEVTYVDPCGLGRLGGGIYDEPREALQICGVQVSETRGNRENGPCCGGGGAVRAAYRDLYLKVAGSVLRDAPSHKLVTPCSFCQFNYSYAARKTGGDKEIIYLARTILDALNGSSG